ncbi:hypothetical protein BDZ85DRAFT_269926 [Elsinoe ampelina]|uniref:Uncharacterized protein n=1 Tax=Elsinoe ampelina TaxID=302913 RepID=A0A6A6FZH8_9PEZI|nr:hypothetical protein BDZ85DRAFT_269926 [Elsinoe ampelina]
MQCPLSPVLLVLEPPVSPVQVFIPLLPGVSHFPQPSLARPNLSHRVLQPHTSAILSLKMTAWLIHSCLSIMVVIRARCGTTTSLVLDTMLRVT